MWFQRVEGMEALSYRAGWAVVWSVQTCYMGDAHWESRWVPLPWGGVSYMHLPSTPRLAQSSCSLPRSPGTPVDVQRNLVQTPAPPSAAHQAQLLPFRSFFQESNQDFLAGLQSPYQ